MFSKADYYNISRLLSLIIVYKVDGGKNIQLSSAPAPADAKLVRQRGRKEAEGDGQGPQLLLLHLSHHFEVIIIR